MAKFEIKFFDYGYERDFIKCEQVSNKILISGDSNRENFSIVLDKSTAIKFAKTLRTEINKITESEVKDGR